jgi:hypothetical protein
LKTLSAQFNPTFNHIRELYPQYTLQNLASHRAIVLFPYAVMPYSIVDFYASNMPIFVPSIDFLIKYKNLNVRTIKLSVYCGENSQDINGFNRTNHPFSPYDDSPDAQTYWFKYADYFHWPYVTVFESFDDLIN